VKKLAAGLTLAACVAASLVLGTADARAGLFGCGPASYQQPFVAWGDYSSYVLAPGGSFEKGPGWSLAGGARVVGGNEPFHLNSARDSHSLLLPSGSSATAPATCLGALDPTLRMVGKSSDGSPVHVDVYASGALGLVKLPTAADVSLSQSWDASSVQLLTVQNILALSNLGTTSIVLRFSAIGSASVQLDDVYVDPVFHE
jgi:hypothetical protein